MLTSETPWVVFKRLNVLNINNKHITRLSSLDLKRSCQIVDLGQVHVSDVVCRVIVLDLTSSPVDALDLHCLAILDGSGEWNCSPRQSFSKSSLCCHVYRLGAICSIEKSVAV